MLTDALEIHFISMAKFRQSGKNDIVHNRLYRWLAFFDKNTDEETLKTIITMDTAIAKAQEKIKRVSSSKEALRVYQMCATPLKKRILNKQEIMVLKAHLRRYRNCYIFIFYISKQKIIYVQTNPAQTKRRIPDGRQTIRH
jgi:hypothetical protein